MTEVKKYTETRTFDSDTALAILGVPGRLKRRTVCYQTKIGCWEHQNWLSERRTKVLANGEKVLMHAEIRFDDNCHNGHNSFAITGFGWYDHHKTRDWDFGGCCHEMIAEVFPELEPLIKWHLVSTDSPMHYVANTVYHASNLENGKAKGEPNRWETRLRFTSLPTMTFGVKASLAKALSDAKSTKHVPGVLDLVEVPYVKDTSGSDYQFDPHYTLGCYPVEKWHEAPYKSKGEALEWQTTLLTNDWELVNVVTGYSKGKERNLEYARRAAKWPEATDEQLCLPAAELTALLEARLPTMVAEFHQAMAEIGMAWSPEEFEGK
jgi:hypothetical protein